MTNQIQKQAFNNLMRNLNIQPSKEKSNAEKFYEWMKNCKNKFLHNEVEMAKAMGKIIEY